MASCAGGNLTASSLLQTPPVHRNSLLDPVTWAKTAHPPAAAEKDSCPEKAANSDYPKVRELKPLSRVEHCRAGLGYGELLSAQVTGELIPFCCQKHLTEPRRSQALLPAHVTGSESSAAWLVLWSLFLHAMSSLTLPHRSSQTPWMSLSTPKSHQAWTVCRVR